MTSTISPLSAAEERALAHLRKTPDQDPNNWLEYLGKRVEHGLGWLPLYDELERKERRILLGYAFVVAMHKRGRVTSVAREIERTYHELIARADRDTAYESGTRRERRRRERGLTPELPPPAEAVTDDYFGGVLSDRIEQDQADDARLGEIIDFAMRTFPRAERQGLMDALSGAPATDAADRKRRSRAVKRLRDVYTAIHNDDLAEDDPMIEVLVQSAFNDAAFEWLEDQEMRLRNYEERLRHAEELRAAEFDAEADSLLADSPTVYHEDQR